MWLCFVSILCAEDILYYMKEKIQTDNRVSLLFMIDNLLGGGAERILSFILQNIDRKKFDVSLFLVIHEGVYLSQIPNDVKILYIFRSVKRFSFLPMKYLYRLYRRTCLELFKLIPAFLSLRSGIQHHYDIGISFCEGHNLSLLSLKARLFTKTISWIHVDLRFHHCPLGIPRVGRYASKADHVYFVSNDALAGFKELFPGCKNEQNMEVVYNPVNADEILKQSELSPEIPKNKFTILAIGRLTKQKRFDKLINVHKRLLDKGIDNQVWILGEGEDKSKLETQAKNLGVSESCKFLGYQNSYIYLKSADLFVMTSDYEGLPVVVCEAMVLAKPIVSTCVTGPRELLEDGKYGLLTDNNEEAIEKGMKDMILSQELREKYVEKLKENRNHFIFPTNLSYIEKRLLSL